MTVAKGYRGVPPEDQAKAKRFFDQGKTVGDTGQYDYGIEMFLNGLNIDPDSVEAHQALRDIAMRRKASGGKDLGMFEKMKLKRSTKNDKQNMLNYEKLLSYDPGSCDAMAGLIQAAHKAGFYDTVLWIGPILLKCNDDSKSPDVSKYIILKDIYKDIEQWKLATEACQHAVRIRPQDMELLTELKNISASETMYASGYAAGGNFQTTMANKDAQEDLLKKQKDVVSIDVLQKAIMDAEADFKTDPNDMAKLNRLVEALLRTEELEHENRAIELFEEAYKRTGQFPYRLRVGKIQMKQLSRSERAMRAELAKNPKDDRLREDHEQFVQQQVEFELSEYQLACEKYPTDMSLKFEVAQRLFALKQFNEAISLFQQAKNDPKLKNDALVGLGRAFLEDGYVDEAAETLGSLIEEYQIKGDDRSKLMFYWQGRAFEAKGNLEMALKRYSQVAQWEFTYGDVQQRIKRLRSAPKGD
jgi:tetratricopeptide (TPR) repeat protein